MIPWPATRAIATSCAVPWSTCARLRQAERDGLPSDLVSIDVREAVDALGQVTGETASEDLLSTIFSQFCIGK